MSVELDKDKISGLLNIIKQKEYEGFSYDTALASFEVLVRKELGQINDYYILQRFRVTDERRWNAKGKLVTESEATININVNGEEKIYLNEKKTSVINLYDIQEKIKSLNIDIAVNIHSFPECNINDIDTQVHFCLK